MATSRLIDLDDDSCQPPAPTDKGGDRGRWGREAPPISRSKWTRFVRALFLFQLSTQAYVSARHLVPWFLQEAVPLSHWLLQLALSYLCAVMLINWVCLIRYSSEYTKPSEPRDVTLNGFVDKASHRFESNFPMASLPPDSGHVTVDITEKGGLPWKHCERCDMDVPPRTVHCQFCRVCVLRRDHHCHLVGCCIGHWNQRFFVAMAANGMVLGYLGAYLTLSFLRYHHEPQETLWNYFLPVSVLKWLWGSVSGLQAILTFHAYMLCVFGPIASHYFATQLCLIASGKTKREVQRKLKVVVTSTPCANLRLVFGYCWWLSLCLPLSHLFFPQTHQGLCYDNVKMLPD